MQATLIMVGIGGSVVALDRSSGQEVWRTRLKGDFVNLALVDDALFATGGGELFCLDPASGQVRWNNPLRGLGRGLVTIATADTRQSVVLGQKKRDEETTASAAVVIS